jgi:hypothetical protein
MNSVWNKSLPKTAASGPINAAAMPPNNTLDAALGINSGFTLSMAANRNCITHALVTPNRKVLAQNK